MSPQPPRRGASAATATSARSRIRAASPRQRAGPRARRRACAAPSSRSRRAGASLARRRRATPRASRVAGALPPARIPPEALASPRTDQLLAPRSRSRCVIHAVVLAIHFAPFDPRACSTGTPPLEIALVNAKTKDKPSKADILAQANLDGGGNTDADRRAKTPLPVLPKDSADRARSPSRRSASTTLERQTQELMTRIQGGAGGAGHAEARSTPPSRPSCRRRTR